MQPLLTQRQCAEVRFVKEHPVSLCVQDEFGRLLAKLRDPRFAAALERAIERSKQPPPPAALLPAPEQHPASELKGNFPMRRRNLR